MKFLGYAYRFFSNFVFLALVYYSLNFMEKYQQRAIVAILVLVYATMRAVSAFRSFRRDGEMKSYIDLLFLALVILLCVSKIVTD
jgi:hypothetical protein